jgi:1-acyl-sn-glycerol-3-phosphate acyltransferase
MQLLKSLFFTAFMMVSALAFGGFMTLCFWSPYRTQFGIARSWARLQFWLLEKVCGLSFAVEGRERIPAGNHIVMSNHTSAWETIAQFLIFPPQVWVLKRELLWIPLIGWGLKLLRPISINRGAGHRAVNQVIEQGKERLADGLWIIIFPEGTRVVAGDKRKTRPTSGYGAVSSRKPA